MARQSLGRGLSALLGEEKIETKESSASEIDIDLIEPNPEQPRTRFEDEHLNELAASIRVNGIVQPIVVRKHGTRYQIVAGERRWRAAQRAELRRVPVVVKEVSDDKLLEIALIENIQRRELNPIEEANAYHKLMEQIGLTQEQVATRVGKERTLIATTMRLLQLPADIREYISEGKLSLSHGRAILMSNDQSIQKAVALEAIEKGLSVRATESAIKRYANHKSQTIENNTVARSTDPNVKAAESKLMRKLSTNVKILPGKKGTGGKIEIEYYGTDDLDRVFQLLMTP